MATELTTDQIMLDTLLRSKLADLKIVSGNLTSRIEVAVTEIRNGDFTPEQEAIFAFEAATEALEAAKTAKAEAKIAKEEAIKNYLSAHNDGPTRSEIKASREAILSTMRTMGLDTSDLESVDLTGTVMGGNTVSPYFYRKNNGEVSRRSPAQIAGSNFGVSVTVLNAELDRQNNGHDGQPWETKISLNGKCATIGFSGFEPEDVE